MCRGEVRLQVQRPAVAGNRFRRLSLAHERSAQISLGVGKVRLEFQRPAVAGGRFGRLSLGHQRIAQIVVCRGIVGFQHQHAMHVLGGKLVIAGLGVDYTQQVQSLRMVRIDLQNLPVNLLGSL